MFISDVATAGEAPPAIVVTASREAQAKDHTPASVTVLDGQLIHRLGEPLLVSLLRQVPSAAVAVSGPAGSISEVRIRGAEANHTLLFIDGIRANDPAAGNIPRFELLGADLADRIEVVRGPQSALWGSEAIGGVVALTSEPDSEAFASIEGGSHGFARLGGRIGMKAGDLTGNLAGGFQRSDGIDSFTAAGGDRDGYRNLALRGRLAWSPSEALALGVSGFGLRGQSEFDGFESFFRADTADLTRNRLGALGMDGRWQQSGWTVRGSASILRSRNRNLLDGEFVNQTTGGRGSVGLQVAREITVGPVSNRLIVAADGDRERFTARDKIYGGATDQRRRRTHRALTGEWRAEWGPLVTDLAVRRDAFSSFKDATTYRGSALLALNSRWAVSASYADGIAQPSFFDQYGFFPGSFVGNPDLRPERSRGWEAGLRYARGPIRASTVFYRQRLRDEIIDVFLPGFRSTTANADGTSRRSGVEAEAHWEVSPMLRLSASYAFLDASERRDRQARAVQEVRRPRHSGSLSLDGRLGRWTYGGSIALVGDRRDSDFDVFPARTVTLQSYWLAGARGAYRLDERVELFGRIANALGERYQDVVGYRTEGRSVYAGVRLGLGR